MTYMNPSKGSRISTPLMAMIAYPFLALGTVGMAYLMLQATQTATIQSGFSLGNPMMVLFLTAVISIAATVALLHSIQMENDAVTTSGIVFAAIIGVISFPFLLAFGFGFLIGSPFGYLALSMFFTSLPLYASLIAIKTSM